MTGSGFFYDDLRPFEATLRKAGMPPARKVRIPMVEWPFYVGGVLHGESTGLKAVGYTLECIDFSRSWDLLSWSRKAWLPVDHDASFDEIEEAFPEMRC